MVQGRPRPKSTSVSAVFRAPQHPQLRGGAQTLEGAAREWEKFRLELKCAIPGYATDVFVMLELKTKLLFCFFQFQLLVYEKLQFTPC